MRLLAPEAGRVSVRPQGGGCRPHPRGQASLAGLRERKPLAHSNAVRAWTLSGFWPPAQHFYCSGMLDGGFSQPETWRALIIVMKKDFVFLIRLFKEFDFVGIVFWVMVRRHEDQYKPVSSLSTHFPIREQGIGGPGLLVRGGVGVRGIRQMCSVCL